MRNDARARRRTARDRHGVTIVHMLVVISAGSIILSTSAMALHSVLRERAASHEEYLVAGTINRLGLTLRADCHAARDARWVPPGIWTVNGRSRRHQGMIRLNLPGDIAVDYVLTESSLVRRASAGAPGARFETYRFPDEMSIAGGIEEWRQQRIAWLDIDADPTRHRTGQRPFNVRIEGIIGLSSGPSEVLP